MKKLKQLFCFTTIFAMLFSFSSLAAPVDSTVTSERMGNVPSKSAKRIEDKTRSILRGNIISTGIVEIHDNEDGTLYLCIETYAHKNVDRIAQNLYLEQWDDNQNDWVQIEDWEFETTKSENGGELYSYTVELEVDGCTVNREYRARGLHLVRLGSQTETLSTWTDGVRLTN